MTLVRARLAALAASAGYGAYALQLIAEAAVPGHRPGERLDEAGLAQVASAVDVLAQCGYKQDGIADVVSHYRDHYDEARWRSEFWQRQLRTAALRFNHPRFYGLSPCEADPARLAQFGRLADDTARAA